MFSFACALLAVAPLVVAAPAPQITYSAQTAPIAPDRNATQTTYVHGSYTGPAPTVTGALGASSSALALSVSPLPPTPASYTNLNGDLQSPKPVPYQPAGGAGTNGSTPYYHPLSDFDYESLTLALYQEWIELDLFHYGLAQFSVADFEAAGLTAEDRFLIEFMADQEVGHATLLSNILGPAAPAQCKYNYPVSTVREFLDFCQKLTRFGESGVYGFLGHLDSRESATLLLQSISTEARQQMVFRQLSGLFPMPVWFETGIPQSWAWTLLAPYISSCNANTTRLVWQNFPSLTLSNPNINKINVTMGMANDNTTGSNPSNSVGIVASNYCVNSTSNATDCDAAISQNRTMPLSYPGRAITLSWGNVNETVGPNNSYVTSRSSLADAPRYALFVAQLNATYVPLMNISGNSAVVIQPNTSTFAGDPTANGTMFIAITSTDTYVSPFNLSNINPYVYAGPAIYQAG